MLVQAEEFAKLPFGSYDPADVWLKEGTVVINSTQILYIATVIHTVL